ncbi:hypothetical protein LOAG_11114 [Loa loa]|uniref:Uncharacterized protein n=1 Tax=Loa loa TaxID=7209 RepID=A0A1S0TNL1_LOALO|nr:hypothetical protein LOAG_11114 [Loa loa]EFO17385.1 hypothetical protein LOAG_11114 [Loa loa]
MLTQEYTHIYIHPHVLPTDTPTRILPGDIPKHISPKDTLTHTTEEYAHICMLLRNTPTYITQRNTPTRIYNPGIHSNAHTVPIFSYFLSNDTPACIH